MSRHTTKLAAAFTLLLAGMSLGGCIIVPPYHHYHYGYY